MGSGRIDVGEEGEEEAAALSQNTTAQSQHGCLPVGQRLLAFLQL